MGTLKNITKILKALSDESRIRIISLLGARRDLCVCEITKVIELSQPTISSHLKLLENAGLIVYKKDGLWVNYNINPGLDENVKEILDRISLILSSNEKINEDHREIYRIDRKNICKK